MKNKQIDESFDQLIENKFMTASRFSMEVEEIVKTNQGSLNYIDAILVYCEQQDIELENVSKLISKPLKEKIKVDAQRMNFMKKTSRARLPL
jgi:ribosome-interacting GTPase 1